MSSKKTITIPASVGSNTLSETFGKITFSKEVKELLSACGAELIVRYIPGAEKPVLEVSKHGKAICSLDEFKALSGYRRFVSDAIKEADKATSTTEKIKIVSFFLRQAANGGINAPARLLEQNQTKFNQFGSTLQLLEKHAEIIDLAIDNDWKTYVQDKLARVVRILYSAQIRCMGTDVLDRDYIDDELFVAGVPKWIYTKFLDKNYTSNMKHDCVTLLFPKNNYLKSIAFSTREMHAEPFLTANQMVLASSGGIIALSRTDFSALYPTYSVELTDQVQAWFEKYQWVLTNPATAEEILTLRETGKTVPVFREAQPPRPTGRDRRPETELGKTCRQIANLLGKIQATWNGILNFVIPVANPRTEFWVELFGTAENWEITPTNSIYNCIRAEDNMRPLNNLRNASSNVILQRIGNIVATVSRVPSGSADATMIVNAFTAIHNRQAFRLVEEFDDQVAVDHPMHNMDGFTTRPVSDEEIAVGRTFLGLQGTITRSKKKRSGASAVRLHSSVLNELKPLEGHAIYDQVVDWLRSTFKTGERRILQKIAAERILGEALKHQDVMFEEDLEIQDFEEIEEYYDEEE